VKSGLIPDLRQFWPVTSRPCDELTVFQRVYGHFGPKTLRSQDISALVPKYLGHFGTTYTSYTEVSH